MLVIWKERARPLRERRGAASAVMSSPPKRTSPASGCSSPEICLMNVVLPAPFGPMTACVSPSRTSKSTLSVATSAPNDFFNFFVSKRILFILAARQEPSQSAAREQHDEHEEDPEVELPVVAHQPARQQAPALQHVFQQQQCGRAEDGSRAGGDAAEDHHEHELA